MQPFRKLLLCFGANELFCRLAIFKQDKSRQSAYAKLGCYLWCLGNVQFREFDASCFPCEITQKRFHRTAGGAMISKEIDEHFALELQYFLGKMILAEQSY